MDLSALVYANLVLTDHKPEKMQRLHYLYLINIQRAWNDTPQNKPPHTHTYRNLQSHAPLSEKWWLSVWGFYSFRELFLLALFTISENPQNLAPFTISENSSKHYALHADLLLSYEFPESRIIEDKMGWRTNPNVAAAPDGSGSPQQHRSRNLGHVPTNERKVDSGHVSR